MDTGDVIEAIAASEARVTHRIDTMDTRINGRIGKLEETSAAVSIRHAGADATKARHREIVRYGTVITTLVLSTLGIFVASGLIHT